MHVGSTTDIGGIVVGPLEIAMIRALRAAGGGVGDVPVLLLKQRGCSAPIPNALGPVGICLVSSVQGEAGRKLEQSSVRNRVLCQVTVLVWPNLPAHTTVAATGIPAGVLSVEDTLCEGYPGGFAVSFGVVEFRGGYSGETPKDLIVVSEVLTVVAGEEIVVALLEVHSFLDGVVELSITGYVPVQDKGHEHGTALPPSAIEFTGDVLGLARVVVLHHGGGDRFGCAFDGV